MNLSELRAIAQKALDEDPEEWFLPGVVKSYSRNWLGDIEDAHIAAFSPATVLRLLDVVGKARAVDQLHEQSTRMVLAGDIEGATAFDVAGAVAFAALRDALKGLE